MGIKIVKKENIKSGIISLDKIISLKHAPHIFDRLDKCSLGEDRQKIEVLMSGWRNIIYHTRSSIYW